MMQPHLRAAASPSGVRWIRELMMPAWHDWKNRTSPAQGSLELPPHSQRHGFLSSTRYIRWMGSPSVPPYHPSWPTKSVRGFIGIGIPK